MRLICKILLIPFLLLFATCKKYPDGGFTSRGPKMLLKHEGLWYLEKYMVNGIDSTELINFNNDPEKKYKKIDFVKDSKYSGSLICHYYPITATSVKFEDNNMNMKFLIDCYGIKQSTTCYDYWNYNGCYKNLFTPECGDTKWKIQQLTKNRLELTTTLTNNYKIILINNE